MQQILLSSQNILPNQAKVANSAPSSQAGSSSFTPPSQGLVATSNLSGIKNNSPLVPVNQELKGEFVDILNGLELSQGPETMQSASLEGWKNLLNDNPALFDQLEKNPEIANQIQEFIEGQTLSKEGETLPPLSSGEGGGPLLDSSLMSSEVKTSDAALTLQQVVEGFLSEQQVNELDTSAELKLSAGVGSSSVLGGELANVSASFVSIDQNNANIKAWGRFANGSQGENILVNQEVSVAGSQAGGTVGAVNAGYSASTSTTLDRGGSNSGLMVGAVNSLQSETDAQFKASFESFGSLDSEAGDLIEPSRILERSDSSKSQFSEIQSKLQGAGLKQYSTSLETNVQDPEWGDEMGQKIVWLTGRAIQSAEIHLNPADLGPIEVKINVQNDQAAVTFHAQNSTVRDMLESNVHRLRDMMESNGVDLAEVSVGSDESGGQYAEKDSDRDESGGNGKTGSGSQNDLLGDVSDDLAQTSSVSSRIVDFYA